MLLKKSYFEDIEKSKKCNDPEHEPPKYLCIPQGKRYIHVCPKCGNSITITPPQISF